MRLSFCFCLALSFLLPAAAQHADTTRHGYFFQIERVGYQAADLYTVRPFAPSSGVGQWRETTGRFSAGRRVGDWEVGVRMGWAEEALTRRRDPDLPLSLDNYERLELQHVTVGPRVAWTRPLGERLGLRVETEAWADFGMTDGLSSVGLDGAGFRTMSTVGYRVGTDRVAVVPTVGLYGQLVHRFADTGVRSPYGGPAFPSSGAVSDFELGIRTALPVLLRLGGVTTAIEPYLDWGSGTSSDGLRIGGGIGLRVGF